LAIFARFAATLLQAPCNLIPWFFQAGP
jgi:hypothetical protein